MKRLTFLFLGILLLGLGKPGLCNKLTSRSYAFPELGSSSQLFGKQLNIKINLLLQRTGLGEVVWIGSLEGLEGFLEFLHPLESLLQCFKKWRHLSVALKMNLFKAATRPISLCTSFTLLGEVMSSIALNFFELASMPRCETINPKNLPDETLNTHFAGFNHI